MARNTRGSSQGAQKGSRAKGEPKGGRGRAGRRTGDKYTALPPKTKTEETPCIARGRHGKDCICGGTGKIRTVK
jgi:hypothetical protein